MIRCKLIFIFHLMKNPWLVVVGMHFVDKLGQEL